MTIATTELDRTEHRNPAAHGGHPSGPHHSPARRPASPNATDRRAATRSGGVRGRRSVAVLALLVIVVGALLLLLPGRSVADAMDPTAPAVAPVADMAVKTITGAGFGPLVLGEGETVWDLVLPHLPAGVDAQSYVRSVLDHNGLLATAVPPGTVIRLP